MATDLFDSIASGAAAESPLWGDAVVDAAARRAKPVFSVLAEERFALGVETIYEGYLVHYGHPRLFDPPDADAALLLGDYLYAHGLVRIAETGDVDAVRDLAELISLCAQLRAEERDGDGIAWAATAGLLGRGALDDERAALRDLADPGPLERVARAAGGEAVDTALAAHTRFVTPSHPVG